MVRVTAIPMAKGTLKVMETAKVMVTAMVTARVTARVKVMEMAMAMETPRATA
jgi:hypothetical protein